MEPRGPSVRRRPELGLVTDLAGHGSQVLRLGVSHDDPEHIGDVTAEIVNRASRAPGGRGSLRRGFAYRSRLWQRRAPAGLVRPRAPWALGRGAPAAVALVVRFE
jgi:hypothetical protein